MPWRKMRAGVEQQNWIAFGENQGRGVIDEEDLERNLGWLRTLLAVPYGTTWPP